jgi:hypothetical protein
MRSLRSVLLSSFVFFACNSGSETDPVFGASSAADVSAERIAAWDKAANLGDYRDAGYLTVAAFAATPASGITAAQVTNWDTAFGWGDHSTAGYLTVAAFTAFPAFSITAAQVGNWDSAYGWGDHAAAGYQTVAAFTATPAAGITAAQVGNWDTAFGWGDHSAAGYQTIAAFMATPAGGITATNISSWNAAAARTETDPKVGTLANNTIPRWNGTSLANTTITQTGTRIGVGTSTPKGALSVGTVAHLGAGVVTNTSKTCSTAGFEWTHTPPSAAACDSYCTTAGFAAGVVSTQGSKSCGGATCTYISDYANCTLSSVPNNGFCDTCAASFVCTCLTPGSVFDADVKVNSYLQLSTTAGSPPAADCDAVAERGRIKADSSANLLWLCTASGWVSK